MEWSHVIFEEMKMKEGDERRNSYAGKCRKDVLIHRFRRLHRFIGDAPWRSTGGNNLALAGEKFTTAEEAGLAGSGLISSVKINYILERLPVHKQAIIFGENIHDILWEAVC